MVKICQKCGNDNLDFKIFCGSCGEALPDNSVQGRSNDALETKIESRKTVRPSNSPSKALGESVAMGVLLISLPIPITLLIFQQIGYLIELDLVSMGLVYGATILIIIELFLLFVSLGYGFTEDKDVLRIALMPFPIRTLLALMLFFSIASMAVLLSLELFGKIPGEAAWGEALLIFITVVWILFFGPLKKQNLDNPN